ncbi:hypothetical protein RGQ29_024176 [Quercus rubra]|uniref:Uncharacterized protein n=1 Tax=Quercus rubra TaxID=3512 RepID=A0AAN7FAD7_QUERU|nr:hypothetical protein RGQ29_024176 [Quercus rubra]
MASDSLLLGPPQINTKSTTTTAIESSVETLNLSTQEPTLGFTENCSLTYKATGNPCLDFFFHVVPSTPSHETVERVQKAWAYHPLTTLKLICNLRGVRGTGKSDKQRFYTAALWLYKHHPKTLALNVRSFADFGYFKDLLEILYLILEGESAREIAKREWFQIKLAKGIGRKMHSFERKRLANMKKTGKNKNKNKTSKLPKELRVKQNIAKVNLEREHARTMRKERVLAMAKKAFERYNRDPVYRFLHDAVSDVFAEMLKADMQALNEGKHRDISLAAKWCPTIDSAYDKSLLICESIAKRVFPKDSDPEYQTLEDAHYAYRVRDRLRKQVLVPLHKVLELPEVYMSANMWETLPYNRVPSVAMKNYKEHFLKHDNKRFQEYLESVKHGEATIAAGALLPHEIIASLNDGDGGQVAELQWKRMVDDLLKKGKLSNCIAVCDVSGSMYGEPMNVCVALGLMISELSEEPWKGQVITFDTNPTIQMVQGDSLSEKTQFIRNMKWGGSTNFQAVFDQILDVAVQADLTEDQLIQKVFVFSDMEFDQASGHHEYGGYYGGFGYGGYNSMDDDSSDMDSDESESDVNARRQRQNEARQQREREAGLRSSGWETDYEVIQRKFRENGYNKVPEIVFWNLRNSKATPVPSDQSGVALVSGFSKNLVKLFLENGGIINPVAVMHEAISGEMYQKLAIYD